MRSKTSLSSSLSPSVTNSKPSCKYETDSDSSADNIGSSARNQRAPIAYMYKRSGRLVVNIAVGTSTDHSVIILASLSSLLCAASAAARDTRAAIVAA